MPRRAAAFSWRRRYMSDAGSSPVRNAARRGRMPRAASDAISRRTESSMASASGAPRIGVGMGRDDTMDAIRTVPSRRTHASGHRARSLRRTEDPRPDRPARRRNQPPPRPRRPRGRGAAQGRRRVPGGPDPRDHHPDPPGIRLGRELRSRHRVVGSRGCPDVPPGRSARQDRASGRRHPGHGPHPGRGPRAAPRRVGSRTRHDLRAPGQARAPDGRPRARLPRIRSGRLLRGRIRARLRRPVPQSPVHRRAQAELLRGLNPPTAMWQDRSYSSSGFGSWFSRAPATVTIIGITVAMFLAQVIANAVEPGLGSRMTQAFEISDDGWRSFELWRPFTYLLAHGGTAHILMNMLILGFAGAMIEPSSEE